MSERTSVRAAVLNSAGSLDFETLYIDDPGPHEVRVRPMAVGLCHSDLHYVDGTHLTELPEVLGHEAAGVVESVGSEVEDLLPGDHVVSSLTMFCGTCRFCVQGRMSLCANRARLRSREPARSPQRAVSPSGNNGRDRGLCRAFSHSSQRCRARAGQSALRCRVALRVCGSDGRGGGDTKRPGSGRSERGSDRHRRDRTLRHSGSKAGGS